MAFGWLGKKKNKKQQEENASSSDESPSVSDSPPEVPVLTADELNKIKERALETLYIITDCHDSGDRRSEFRRRVEALNISTPLEHETLGDRTARQDGVITEAIERILKRKGIDALPNPGLHTFSCILAECEKMRDEGFRLQESFNGPDPAEEKAVQDVWDRLEVSARSQMDSLRDKHIESLHRLLPPNPGEVPAKRLERKNDLIKRAIAAIVKDKNIGNLSGINEKALIGLIQVELDRMHKNAPAPRLASQYLSAGDHLTPDTGEKWMR